jgi:hypothetical protein
MSLTFAGRVIGIRERDGATRMIGLGADGQLRSRRVDGIMAAVTAIAPVLDSLVRADRRIPIGWSVPARIDRQTVTVLHQGKVFVGTATPGAL